MNIICPICSRNYQIKNRNLSRCVNFECRDHFYLTFVFEDFDRSIFTNIESVKIINVDFYYSSKIISSDEGAEYNIKYRDVNIYILSNIEFHKRVERMVLENNFQFMKLKLLTRKIKEFQIFS